MHDSAERFHIHGIELVDRLILQVFLDARVQVLVIKHATFAAIAGRIRFAFSGRVERDDAAARGRVSGGVQRSFLVHDGALSRARKILCKQAGNSGGDWYGNRIGQHPKIFHLHLRAGFAGHVVGHDGAHLQCAAVDQRRRDAIEIDTRTRESVI